MLCVFGLKMPIPVPYGVFLRKNGETEIFGSFIPQECNNLGLTPCESNSVEIASVS